MAARPDAVCLQELKAPDDRCPAEVLRAAGYVYAPNGNPAPGPKFDDKLAWLERMTTLAAWLVEQDIPAMLSL